MCMKRYLTLDLPVTHPHDGKDLGVDSRRLRQLGGSLGLDRRGVLGDCLPALRLAAGRLLRGGVDGQTATSLRVRLQRSAHGQAAPYLLARLLGGGHLVE